MALFRNQVSGIETLKNSCPICHSDVKGNDEYLYFCQKCNILFRKEDLEFTKEAINDLLRKKVAEKFGNDKDRLKIEQEMFKEKIISEDKKKLLEDVKTSKKYFVSKKSNVLHVSNCPYGKNIKKGNRITLKSLEGTDKYKKCKCVE